MLSDGDAIRDLLGTYCERVDAADWDGVGALFADGSLAAADGTVLASGAAAVADFYRRTVKLHDGSPRTKHVVANTVLAVDGTRATARSSYVVLQDLRPIVAGRYVDTFERAGDRWLWRERRFDIDQLGDVGQHLAFRPDV